MRLRTVSAVILTLSIALIPLVNADGGAVVDQPGEFWVYSEGPEINETKMSEYPALYEGEVNSRDSCVWNGTEYLEGHMLDVGQPFVIDGKNVTFEAGGWNRDKEVCLNIPGSGDDVSGDNYFGGDQGGEWYDQDQQKVNEYIRNNKEEIIGNTWTLYWRENPDTYADPETGVIKGEGIALEDDCKVAGTGGTSPCEDIRSDTGFEPPFSAPFTEGQRDDDHDDFRNVFPLEGLNNYHNRVQAGGHTGHPEPLNGQPQDGRGNSQYNETDLELGPLENSRIDAEDDEWALTPDLSYSIANNGTPFGPGRCYGAYRVQGTDKNKRQAVYANSFAGTGQVYNGGNSSTSYFKQNPFFSGDPEAAALDGNWRDPDRLSSFERFAGTSFFSCDLTGNDWGFAYSAKDTEFDCVYPEDTEGVALNQKRCRGEGNPSSPGDEGVFRPDEVNEETGVPDLHAVQASREQLQFDVNSDPYRNLADGWGVIKYTGDSGADKYFIDFVGSRGNIIFSQSRPDQSQAIRVGGIGDLDQDGKREQIFKHRNGSIMSLSLDPDRDTAQDRYRDLGVLSAEHEDFSGIGDIGSELSPGGVADFDGDGDPEAAFISESTELAFVEADGDVQSTDIGAIDAGMAGDWDQDGDPEVVYIASDGSDGKGGTLGVADGDGTFTETPIDDARDAGGIGDVDGDGRPEAVYLDEEWYIGHVDSEIEFSEGFGDGAGQDGLAPQARDIGGVGDADGDGILEVSFVKGEKEGTSESTDLDIWTVDRNGQARRGLASDYQDFQGSTGALMMGGYVPPRSDRNRNLAQYPNACGDDPNEYLIREHAATLGGEDNPSFSGRENMYACADRPSDCVFQGEVYSAGQVVDVQENSAGENGVNSYDQEICADIDPELPGGEWVDVDNEKIRDMLVGDGTGSEPEYLVQNGRPEPDDPGDIVWHDGTRDGEHNKAAHEAMISPFNPVDYQTGYALEDDCDPAMAEDRLGACDDSGSKEKLIQGELIYSPFKTMKSDDHNVFSTEAISMYVGDGTGEDGSDQHGQNNGQDTEAVSPNTDFTVTEDGKNVELNDSEINRLEDTWAVSSYTGHVVGPTGRVYENGSCYGTPALSQGDLNVNKGEKVVANSFAKAFDVDEDGQDEGVWVDPDTTEKSVTRGGTSCDLVGEDWGIGYNTGSGLEVRDANDKTAYEPTDLHVVTGDITFDINSDPNGFGEDRNLEQHPNVCGDDRNEYLIREHGDAVEKTEQSPNLDQDNIYVCADRISDCAFNGEVYSEGQLVDIQSNQREEKGADSIDEEVCVDVDKSVPGGEWVDVDDESINQLLKGTEGSYNEDNPDTYEGLVRSNISYDGPGIKWFTDEYAPAAEVEKSPFNPLDYSDGYALEDDVGPDVQFTSDEGPDEEKFTPDAVYSFFEELHRTDDRKASLMKGATDEEIREGDLFTGISVRMYVGTADGDASYKHGATNGQDQENVPDSLDFTVTKNGKTVPLNDSTIDPLEDTWAISTHTDAVVGPTGKVYENGSCYGRNVLDQPDLQLTKAQKAVGNSYAMSLDVNGDGTSLKKGVWVNPDSTPKSVTSGGLGCELNATDWGIGYDTGPGSDLNVIRGAGSEPGDVRERGYDRDDPHAVTGDIQFDYESDPGTLDQDNLKQYPDACGDDRNEYLIREHNASERFNDEDNPSLVRDNIYVCADRISDCAFNGSVYSEGEVVDIQAGDPPGQDEEAGVNSVDEEICVDVDETVPGGEWMDVDNSSINQLVKGKEGTYTEDDPSTYEGHVRSNLTYDGEGVKWFTDEYAPAAEVEKSPFNPLNYSDGYALEDDCGPGVNCSDEGEDIIDFTPEADYSFFEAGNITDDRIDSVYSTGNWDRIIEGEVFNGISVRMWVGYANGTAYYEHGSSNGQDQQNAPEDLNFNVTKFGKTVPLNDSTIDPLEDTWAIANRTDAVVGPTGKVYMNGSCYGQDVLDYENLTVTKAERAVGNSYAMSLDVDGDGTSNRQGVWVNPDSTPKSAVSGGLSCELNSTDWGFGYNIGEGTELREVRGSGSEPGDIRQQGYDRDDPHVVAGDIRFDNESDPTGYDQDNLRQYPDACGDDRNEYLIREHRGTGEGIEHNPSLQRDNIYVCADRISDCALNGSVYSEGEVADIQANDPPGADEEAGADSVDEEVCVDVDNSVPGGEWLDVDNESLNQYLKGAESEYTPDAPSTYKSFVRANSTYDGPGIKWFTDEYAPAAEVEKSPFNPLNYSDGYALEDDVGPGVNFTSDEGSEEERFTPDAVYSYFTESHITDDRTDAIMSTDNRDRILEGDVFEGISVRMRVGSADGTAYYRHERSNSQEDENVPSDVDFNVTRFGKTVSLNDSTIDPLEDTWAIANRTDAVVGPTGKVYMNGSCYGKSVTSAESLTVTKGERVVANSYAMSLNVDGDGSDLKRGVWVDPDSTVKSAVSGDLSCELNATDWGFGYNKGQGTELVKVVGSGDSTGDIRQPGYDRDDPHVVAGDIQFDNVSDPTGYNQDNLRQYPDACGDDRNEYLIREHRGTGEGIEHNPSLVRDNIYVCADRISDCAFNGSVYSEGEVVDIQANDPPGADEEAGADSIDEEICVDVDKTVPGGEWLDVDNESLNSFLKGNEGSYVEDSPDSYSGHVRSNQTYDGPGIKWFTDDYGPAAEVELSPYNPLNYSDGYALEDDVGPGVEFTSDEGPEEEKFTPDAVYSFFEDSHITDDRKASVLTEQGENPLDGELFEGISVQMKVGFADGRSFYRHGSSNNQDQENVPSSVDFTDTKFGKTVSLNDSTIDPLEDTWAIANRTDAVVGPTGKVYMNGSCYGKSALTADNFSVNKGERVVANSYAMSLDINGDGTERNKGVWVNPDSTPKSALSGVYSCELNATDWGYGYNTGDGSELTAVAGEVRQEGYSEGEAHVVVGDIQFDNESDPEGVQQDNLRQYPDACGDDRNEYLIREHRDSSDRTEQSFTPKDDMYVCADRISDCALDGEVYSEGQLADVQSSDREERGPNSVDEEVCVDVDKSVPGGEWLDVDNESINQLLKGEEGTYTPDEVSSYNANVRWNGTYDGEGVKWFTHDYSAAREVEISPYNPLNYSDGYALEDDVGPGVDQSSDEGARLQRFTPDAVYSFFEPGHIEDDRVSSLVETGDQEAIREGDVFSGISVKMRVGYANGTAYTAHGRSNSQDEQNVPTGLDFTDTKFGVTVPLNDSTIDPREDTWAIANRTDAVVGPTGRPYLNGSCYGPNALDDPDLFVSKAEKVVGNSYAMSLDVDGDGTDTRRGIWVNPDSTVDSALVGGMRCDLNATDWGYGFDQGEELQVKRGDARTQGYSEPEGHVVAGDIQFDSESDPVGQPQDNLKQYPDACGDDRNEYLIREHTAPGVQSEHDPSLERDNIYVCADRISDCAFNGSVYSMGQTADVSGTDEELGVNSDDAEICVDMNEDIPGGEWADPDNATIQRKIVGSGEFEKPSTYAGDPTYERRGGGVRWFNTSYSPETQYPINESYTSPWSEVNYSAGYAFEDDCGPDVEFCEDSGLEETKKEGKAVFGPFQEGELADDGNAGIDGYHIRTWVDGSAKHGAQNSQQFENVYTGLPDLNDSTIDPDEDTWAIASEPYYAVGPTGAVYKNGSCYGPDNPDFKSGTVMANSFVLAHDVDGDGTKEGDWVDPDQHERAILLGQGSCTVGEVTDWGLGYNNQSRDSLKIIEGREETRTLGYEEGPSWQKPVVSGPITFDNESVSGEDPGEMNQDDLPQYGNACGDDQYEILIREHSSLTKDLENNRPDEHIPTLERDNIFVCADRVSDCAYNGSVYSEGQVVDVGRDNEAGSNSSDLEVCIDTDKRIPGGEWMDIDNSTWNQYLKGEEGTYTPDQPSTYEHLVSTDSSLRNHWLTDENPHAREVELSPYNPLNYSDGYALEDDCSEGVQYCADIGRDRQHNPTGTVYSSFVEDRGEDDADILEGKAVRMWVGYANGTAYTSHGSTNNQTEENARDLNYTHYKWGVETPLNDSTIDPTEDTWAIANRSQGVVGPTGEIYQAGKCYGSTPDYTQEESIRKNDTVVANSFAYTMEANDDGNSEGVWVNPDSTNQTLLSGGLSCELNTSDWGIGYDNGPDSNLQAIRTSESNIRTPGYEPSDIHSVSGPIAFDSESDPGPKEQRDKPQFPSACGDDQGEFLIREHGTPDGNEYEASLSSRDNIYVCADRISDCAYNGEVYSEGQTVDVSKASVSSEDPERGQNINDPEICLDLDKEIPGGEWYDMDNNFTVKSRIDELGYKPEDTWENVVYFQNRFYGESKATDWKNQSEKLGRYETSFFNASGVQNPEYEYYDPEGYATEDDCGPLLQEAGLGPCGDVGRGTQNTSWFNAGNFSFIPSNPKMQEGAYQDNFDTDLGIRGRHNRIDDSSDQLEPGAATQANFNLTDVFGFGYNISDTRDSTPGPDRWALTRFLNSSIDNRGNVYRPGTIYRSGCFYREGVDRRDSIDDETVLKTEKVYGNSFADASDYDDDGTTEGVWEDPDDMAPMYMNFSCDLTGPDKGLGYDNNSENGVFRYKFNEEDTKTIIGDIAFSLIEGKKGSFAQEPPVCGDDHKEYLIEELGAVSNSLEGEGRFGCGTDTNDCVARSGGEYALYRNGDYVNTDEAVEDFGRIKQDQEVCQQTVGDRYGVWYDQDYSREFCRTNNLYGRAGVRWMSQDYIDRYPYSVEGGINDDLNPYLYNKMSEFNVSTQGNISRYVGLADRSGYTPVGTGKDVKSSVKSEYRGFVPPENYLNLTATAGFCGGDDLGEAVVVQESATQLIPSNYSVIGIADSVDDCPLDGSNIDAVDHNRRQIYNEGENVTLDLGPTERTISCQSGKWYADWPVVFLRDSLSVEQESTVDIPFKVVNVRDSQTTYNVTLDPQSSIDAFTGFTRFDKDRFQTTVSAQSTRRFNVEFYGQDTDLGPEDIEVKVESLDGEINGTDTVAVNVKQDVNKEQVSGTEEVPGIGSFQLLVLMLAAYTVYMRLVVRKDI